MFSKPNALGLTDILTGKKELKQCVQNTELETLQIITAGTIPPNPAEILESKKMREFIDLLRDCYDYIFIDTPPIGIIMDAGVLANYSDGTILVVGAKDVETERAKMAKERLEKVKANVIGAVLNKYIEKNSSYGYYSYYYEQSDSSRVSKHKKKKKH
ncbi:CpsD/CapB family tyrosine-protein kinase [Paraclostridium bifermentans]|uniref:CpsD/CapB family tyrosine-protein kinase n=1 Tax=Paraclostridium bifermentans TaxID=1490 RepID=UPI00290EDBC8|nr:CpsD/CapB family tyrosine-protein kinase [Paraclostridium bifermentans]MDU3335625.1 CpsD/CapB family tyrosine-protein kinase [Paraclostridium bifermentans]